MGAIKLAGARRYAPLPAYRFSVIFRSLVLSRAVGFRRISGISLDQEIFEWDEGVGLRTKRVLPGPHRAGDVTFERGVDITDRFSRRVVFNWMQASTTNDVLVGARGALSGVPTYSPQRTDIIILVHPRGPRGGPIARGGGDMEIKLHRCLPRKLELSDLDATSSEFLISKLVVAPEAVTFKLRDD